jgi:predicted flavoprotein YhiN
MNMKIYDVVIVGGGAAGCVAAGYAAQNGKSVLVLERNRRPARKILVTGKAAAT